MNFFRFIGSGMLFLFSILTWIVKPDLPFSLPMWVYVLATAYFAFFPIKDMISVANTTLYKGRQYKKRYVPNSLLNQVEFKKEVHTYNLRALGAMIFWLCFMAFPASLYLCKIVDRNLIFFFFALSNFSVFFALYFWCPFRSIMIRPTCCNECRIYNWDSFFAYSFLILIPNVYTIILFTLGVLSLVEWEIMHAVHPERFYKVSNLGIQCSNCDLKACKNHRKRRTQRKKYVFHS